MKNAALVAVLVLLTLAFAAIPYFFKAGGEGRCRRGVGWYLDVRSKRSRLAPGGEPTGHEIGMSHAGIRRWGWSGIGLLILAAVAWVVADIPALGVFIGLVGILSLGAAIQGWRENRYLAGQPAGSGTHPIPHDRGSEED